MKILTYNIMNAGKDLFPSRKGWWFTRTIKQMKMIKKENPDVFCLNESTPLQQLLFFFMKGYRCKGWYTQNPIFYKKEYKCVYSKCFLLKDREKYLRTFTKIAICQSNLSYIILNTHLDWTNNRAAQKEQIYDSTMPVTDIFVCGDFNKENDTFFEYKSSKPTVGTYKNAVIDYIFSDEKTPRSCKVLTEYDDLSDHRPLICEYD